MLKKSPLGHICTYEGGNKCIAAQRYVHGIIQIQVREQVLPTVGGLAKPDSRAFSPAFERPKPFSAFSNFLFSKHTVPFGNPSIRYVHGIIICSFFSRTKRGTAFLFSVLPFGFTRRSFSEGGSFTFTNLPAIPSAMEGKPFTDFKHVNSNRRT